jgi:hypothetical protein
VLQEPVTDAAGLQERRTFRQEVDGLILFQVGSAEEAVAAFHEVSDFDDGSIGSFDEVEVATVSLEEFGIIRRAHRGLQFAFIGIMDHSGAGRQYEGLLLVSSRLFGHCSSIETIASKGKE